MKSFLSVTFFFFLLSLSAQEKTTFPASLLLVPEKSNFEKTSTYADVMSFLNAIKPVLNRPANKHANKQVSIGISGQWRRNKYAKQ
jgi:hypothetical protein